MKPSILALTILGSLTLAGCDKAPTEQQQTETSAQSQQTNSLMTASPLQYEAPQFDKLQDSEFIPAFEAGMAAQLKEVAAIANNTAPVTFENTLVALEQSGELLTRVSRIFYNLVGSTSNDQRRAIQKEMAPRLSAHYDNINLNGALFEKVETLYQERENLELDSESVRLIEVYYQRFVRAGAKLNDEQKNAIRAINEEHSTLTTQFGQNLMAEYKNIAVVVDDVKRLEGMSEGQIAAAKAAAEKQDLSGKYLIELTNTTRQPILASIADRQLREKIWRSSADRAQSGETDNRPLVARLAQLRAQKAQLLGYDNWATYGLDAQMAKTPDAVYSMFGSMVPAVKANVEKEAAAIKAMMAKDGVTDDVQPWDWAYYAEKVRQQRYDLDEAVVKQYFEFDRVLSDGVFFTMNKLYGVRFEPRPDLPVYHPDVKAYELFDVDGESLAIFYADYFAREGKRGGAWMSSFVGQSKLLNKKPVVVNVMNIPKGAEGQPTLVSYDHVTTMFHELGHGLHGMFSDVKYPSLAGTAVSRDFVEFPSTFEEDWAAHPTVLANYAKHYKTGEPIPKALLDKILKSRSFNQGFDTMEYISAALLDMEWHALAADAPLQDVNEFEQQALAKHGVDINYVPPRYKSTFFNHSMGGGYSAGYYAYMWSEILAADAFAFVKQQGGLTLENGNHYRKNILSVGNSRPPMESYKAFRGQEPTTEALLIRRGLKVKLDK